MKAYAYAVALAVLIALLAFAHHTVFEAGKAAGATACQEEHARAAAAARVETDRREVASSAATTDMLDYLRANLPPIEAKTHDAVERIRTIYRDRPVAVGCVRPDGVRAELDAARQRANATARGVREIPPGAASSVARAGADG